MWCILDLSISCLKFSPDTLQMQEVVEVHIIQKPSQVNNLTLEQKGKQVMCGGMFACSARTMQCRKCPSPEIREAHLRVAAVHVHLSDSFIFRVLRGQ